MLALLASSLLHVAAMAVSPEFTQDVLIEGSNAQQAAALGSNFADLVKAGDELAPVETEAVAVTHPPVETPATKPVETPRDVSEPVVPKTASASAPPPIKIEPAQSGSLVAAVPVEPPQPAAPELAAVQPPIEQPDPVEPEKADTRIEPVQPVETVVPVEKPKPVVEPEKKKAERKQKSSAGNSKSRSKVNNKSGSQSGTKDAKSQSSGKNKSESKSRETGNAASSNYPGKVYAKVARTRQRNAGGSGVAHVRFIVGASGQATGVSIARSSGNSRIDRAALALVKRAAPFPKPPPGARTRFVIPIEFRR